MDVKSYTRSRAAPKFLRISFCGSTRNKIIYDYNIVLYIYKIHNDPLKYTKSNHRCHLVRSYFWFFVLVAGKIIICIYIDKWWNIHIVVASMRWLLSAVSDQLPAFRIKWPPPILSLYPAHYDVRATRRFRPRKGRSIIRRSRFRQIYDVSEKRVFPMFRFRIPILEFAARIVIYCYCLNSFLFVKKKK